jgi:hypothetical protein
MSAFPKEVAEHLIQFENLIAQCATHPKTFDRRKVLMINVSLSSLDYVYCCNTLIFII